MKKNYSRFTKRNILILLLFVFSFSQSSQSQKVKPKVLQKKKVEALKTDSIATNVNIRYNRSKQENSDGSPMHTGIILETMPMQTGIVLETHELRYNDVRQISSHNSYDRKGINVFRDDDKHSIYDQAEAGCRSFEFDLHKGHTFPRVGHYPHSDWGIYHTTDYGSGGENCELLSECLSDLMVWHNDNRNHEVITIWLQLDDWEAGGHKPIDLDNNRLAHDLGNNIFTPQKLLSKCPNSSTLQDAIQNCGWPSLESLRNKFIIVLMGRNDEEDRYLNDVNYYRGGDTVGNNGYHGPKLCFVGPDITNASNIYNWPDAIFFNIHNTDGLHLATQVFNNGLVSRVYKLDDSLQWNDAWNAKAHHLATDHINRGIFTPRAINNEGLPFNNMME